MQRQFTCVALSIALMFAAGVNAPRANAATQFSAEEAAVAKKLSDAYGVRVLRIRSGEMDGSPVYIVTVMNPGGNFNAAFQVTTLAVDRKTGALVSNFRRTSAVQSPAGAPETAPPPQTGQPKQ